MVIGHRMIWWYAPIIWLAGQTPEEAEAIAFAHKRPAHPHLADQYNAHTDHLDMGVTGDHARRQEPDQNGESTS
jgi:hypothetical protein